MQPDNAKLFIDQKVLIQVQAARIEKLVLENTRFLSECSELRRLQQSLQRRIASLEFLRDKLRVEAESAEERVAQLSNRLAELGEEKEE